MMAGRSFDRLPKTRLAEPWHTNPHDSPEAETPRRETKLINPGGGLESFAMKTLSINRRLRTMKRISEIIGVLMRNGFADVVQNLHLNRMPGTEPHPENGANHVEPETPRGVRLRR